MTSVNLAMLVIFAAWIALVILAVRRTIAAGSVGLPAALLITMTFLYGGCFVYAVPGYTHLRPDGSWYLARYGFSEWMVVQGAFASVLAIFGFAVGGGIFTRYKRLKPLVVARADYTPYTRKALLILLGIGIASFVMHYARISFPMSDALIEVGRNIAVLAVLLGAYLSWRSGQSILGWITAAAMIPLYYFTVFGFVSYGFLFAIISISFWAAQMRKPKQRSQVRAALVLLVAIWGTLTAFVAWMSFRDEVRDVVWRGEQGSVLEILQRAIANTEVFSLWNFAALDLVNIRLNLPLFIGRMIEWQAQYPQLKEWGTTLVTLPLAPIPRFLWPGKPERGGSEFMEQYTGMALSDSATFGTGSVFEFYLNFGYVGVFLGFVVLGWIVCRIDRMAARHLAHGNLINFARLFVVGIVVVDPLLRPFFIVNGALIAWIAMTALKIAYQSRYGDSGGPRVAGKRCVPRAGP